MTFQTYMVWRDDVRWLGDADSVNEEEISRVFDIYPILSQELLREPTSRIRDKLKKLAKVRGNGCLPTIVLGPDGGITWRGTLEEMVRDDARGKVRLNYAIVVVSPKAGGLTENGLFSPLSDSGADVAEQGQRRRRFFAQGDENGWEAFPGVQATDEAAYSNVNRRELVVSIARGEKLKSVGMVKLRGATDEGEGNEKQGRCLLYFVEAASATQTKAISYVAPQAQPLSDHNRGVGDMARELASRVGLNELSEALGLAGHVHDTGKNRLCWQRAIGNLNPNIPLAKSGHDRFNLRQNGGYRHEFGSLLDAAQELSDEHPHRDLILHLIASHHGHARPHFKEGGYDREFALRLCQESALETLQRFGRLQARYGWWGLAYVEALLKSADALVSADNDQGGVS